MTSEIERQALVLRTRQTDIFDRLQAIEERLDKRDKEFKKVLGRLFNLEEFFDGSLWDGQDR